MSAALPSPYQPISCDFHDLLEALATTRRQAQIRFLDDEGAVQHRHACIDDLFSRDSAEYMALSTGERVRLDRLLAVDKSRLADYC